MTYKLIFITIIVCYIVNLSIAANILMMSCHGSESHMGSMTPYLKA